jgi:hypothetical protein
MLLISFTFVRPYLKGVEMEAISQVVLCPLCENHAPQTLIHVQPCTSGAETILGKRSFELSGACYYVATCETCKAILLYWADKDNKLEDKDFHKAELVWPNPPRPHKSIPPNIIGSYSDALRVKDVPNAFAVQIGRALEQLCNECEITEGDLHERLPRLPLPVELKTEFDTITEAPRYLRNEGAHIIGDGVKQEYVPVIEEFFVALLDYIYSTRRV